MLHSLDGSAHLIDSEHPSFFQFCASRKQPNGGLLCRHSRLALAPRVPARYCTLRGWGGVLGGGGCKLICIWEQSIRVNEVFKSLVCIVRAIARKKMEPVK